MSNLVVVPNEVEGWDVQWEDEPDALANFATRESALRAADKLAAEEGDDAGVVVHEHETHGLGETGRGARFYFLVLIGLLVLITLLVVLISVIGSLTDFGAHEAS